MSRLRCFGHVKRRNGDFVGRRPREMELEYDERKSERPTLKWTCCVKVDVREVGLNEEDAKVPRQIM